MIPNDFRRLNQVCSPWVSVILAPLMLVAAGVAGEQPGGEEKPSAEQTASEVKIAAGRATAEAGIWELHLEDDDRTQATARKESALRWSWSDNGRLYGDVYVYAAHGRPVAIVKFFQWFSPIDGAYFQCTSLTDVPMTATRAGKEIWTPRKNNVVMRDVPGAPRPADTPAARLVQMRRIAEDFNVEVDDKRGTDPVYTTRQLRLLSRPIHRYGDNDEEVIDGAIFAYVVSTDPGAMLILEAARSKGEAKWRFGFPREWSYSARASYHEKRVWEIEEVNPTADANASFYLNTFPAAVK